MAGRGILPVERRVALWRGFYGRENPRRLLGFFHGSEFPGRRYPAARDLPEGRALAPEDFPVDPYLDDFDALHARMEECPGDCLYAASAFWGIPWMEALLGCPIRYSRSTGSLYAVRPEGYRGPGSIPEFDPRDPWAAKAAEFLRKAAVRSGGRYPLATTRLRGIADLLAALYGAEGLVLRMGEAAEEIREAAARIADLYVGFARLQLSLIPAFHGGIGSFYYHAWAPPGTVWHQEDSVMLLSPGLYGTFIRPGDGTLFRAFGGNIVHFHSTGGYLPLREVLSLGPLAVEMHVDEGAPPARALFERHGTILEKAPLIVWGRLSRDDFEWIWSRLPEAGVAVEAVVEDAAEARALWEEFGGP